MKKLTNLLNIKNITYLSLSILIIIITIYQLLNKDFHNITICLLTLIILSIPKIIQKKLNLYFPSPLEITIYLFIFSSGILGEIYNFYEIIPYWDAILHIIYGFIVTAIIYSLITDKKYLSPIFICLIVFSISTTTGVLWEFLEYSADKLILTDTQKDQIITEISSIKLNKKTSNKPIKIKDIDKTIIYNTKGKKTATIKNGYLDIGSNDTMKDLLTNTLGSIIFTIFIYLSLTKNSKTSNYLIKKIVPTKD